MALEWKNLFTLLSHPAVGKLVVLVNLLILVMLARSLAGLTWRMVPAPPAAAVPAVATTASAKATPVAFTTTAQQIAGWHLFGDATKAPQTDVPPPVAMPETKLNLSLRGVLAVDDPKTAQAIIGQPNGQEQSYGIGAALPGGAILKEIKPTSVVLLRNHQYETLSLPKLDDGVDLGAASPDNPAPPPSGMSLRQVRDTLLSNPQSLAGLIRTEPYRGPQGQVQGYRIQPGTDKGLFQRYGLQPGDIVTKVDGVPLDNASNAFRILRGLRSRNDVQVELVRNGSPQMLNLHIE